MSSATKFPVSRREHTGDRAQDAQQRARDQIAGVLNNAPFLRGLVVGPVTLSGNTAVAHKLGRQPVGWFVIDVNTVISLSGDFILSRVSWDAKTITFNATASCNATFWVF